jgi:hypothetical protein
MRRKYAASARQSIGKGVEKGYENVQSTGEQKKGSCR